MKINDKLFCHYKSKLESIANDLSIITPYPINILGICSSLNITIIKENNYLDKAVLVVANDHVGIKLSEEYYDNIDSPFVRHILTHEIGHYLLHYKLNASVSRDEYWVFEELCDFFSRSLLIPKIGIELGLEKVKYDLQQLLYFSKFIAKKYKVTWVTSISRVNDLFEKLLFINFKNANNSNNFIANKSLLPKNKYLNSSLNLDAKYIFDLIKYNNESILLKPEDKEFEILSRKFPIIFRPENKEALVVFRRKNIAIMAIDYAQSGSRGILSPGPHTT